MKRLPNGGYTIIEVMMFLVVSTAIMMSTMAMISDQQEKTRFSQSVTSFEQIIKDLVNDVSTGYYPTAEDFRCESSGGTMSFSALSREQGSNSGCTFIGKAIEFNKDTANYNIFTMAGVRDSVTLKDPVNLAAANIELLGGTKRNLPNQGTQNPGIVERKQTDSDLRIVKIVSLADPTRNVSGLALVSDFSQTAAVTRAVSGNATRTTLYEVNDNFQANAGRATMPVASSGVLLCLKQGDKEASLIIGKQGNLNTEITVDRWPSEC